MKKRPRETMTEIMSINFWKSKGDKSIYGLIKEEKITQMSG